MGTEYKKKFLIDIAFYSVIIAIVYLIFKFLSAYLLPFVIGIFASFLVQRPVRFINRKTKMPRGATTVTLVVFTYFLLVGLIILVFYGLYSWVNSLTKFLPEIMPSISATLQNVNASLSKFISNIPENIITALNDIPGKIVTTVTGSLTSSLSSIAGKIATSTPAILVSIIVTVVASCYIAKDYDKIILFASKHTPKKIWNTVNEIKELFTKTIFRLLRGYALLMLITFTELSIGLGLIGQSNFIMLAAIICIVDILPVLGTGTIVIPWALITLISGNILKAVFLLILYVIISIIRNFLEPKVIGEQVGLHPLVTLLSIFCGYKLIGFMGIFIFPISLIILNDLYKKGTIKLFEQTEINTTEN